MGTILMGKFSSVFEESLHWEGGEYCFLVLVVFLLCKPSAYVSRVQGGS